MDTPAWFDKIGGRKAVVGVIVLAVGVSFVALRGDLPPNLLQLLQVVFGAFVVGNVGEHVANGVIARKAPEMDQEGPPSPPSESVELIAGSLIRIEEALTRQEQAMAVSQQALSAIMKKAGITK